LEVGITYNRMLCNDFTGPARFRLNMPEVALDLKRVWHPCYKDKVKSSAVHLGHMFGSFFKTKTAIMAIALTKTIRK